VGERPPRKAVAFKLDIEQWGVTNSGCPLIWYPLVVVAPQVKGHVCALCDPRSSASTPSETRNGLIATRITPLTERKETPTH
jgi:hypothetical protein